MELKKIAVIRTPFKEKFGIPRQSGITENISEIVFEPEYRVPEALRGLSEYSHLWLIWGFSEVPEGEGWRPTVRPPRLGGNTRMGVFATRSPYRPNPLGLSSVRLVEIKESNREGAVLVVSGADLLDGTPIYDIKPYLSYTDSHPDAVCGFSDGVRDYKLKVEMPPLDIPEGKRREIISVLSQDPRPSYQNEPERVYGMFYSDYEIKFRVADGTLYVLSAERIK